MSYIEQQDDFRPSSGEAPFRLDESFYSRTDDRGVIRSGNHIFRRTADFDWSELLGAPHKIIRHPDMPRGVFWLLWDRLKKGEIVGTYVKNRAKDGLYYWVYAVVAPCEQGYISVRIKPTSPLRDQIEAEYAALRAAEESDGLSPEDSAKRLESRLEDLGFADYDLFAAHALSEELMSRDAGLERAPDARIRAFRTILSAADQLREETQELVDEFHATRTIPHNMQVIASRLEPTGGPVSTLSKNYSAISREMSEWFAENVVGTGSTFTTIHSTVTTSILLAGMARILRECDNQLKAERRELGDIDLATERDIIGRHVSEYEEKSGEGLARVRREATRIRRACETMSRHVLALSSTRVLCKIESGRIAGGGAALTEIIRQLGTSQDRISSRLDRIAAKSESIIRLTS